MRAIWTALIVAALAACSSTPTQDQPPAGVEDRTPSGTQPGAQTQPVQRPARTVWYSSSASARGCK